MAADLSRISLFQGMKPEALRALSERTAVRSLPADAVLMEQGDPAGALYAVLRGRLKIYLTGPEGKEIVVDIRGPGQYLGEMALDGAPRSASVKAIEACEVAEIPREEFAGLLQQNPDVALHMIQNLIRLARGLNLKTLEDVPQRTEALPIYEFTCDFAKLEPPPPEMQQLIGAMQGNQDAQDGFVSVMAGTLPAPEFFAPENAGRIMAAAGAKAG